MTAALRRDTLLSMSDTVVDWLVDSDPAIRWQVLRDLCGSPSRAVAKEQKRVATEGWGARLLAARQPEGGWSGLYSPKWTSTTYSLLLLRQFGLPVANPVAADGARILLDRGLYSDKGINFWHPRRRASETCVTSLVLGSAARFTPQDERTDRLAQNLLAEQMPDGGWNCRRPDGATHSSLHTTILALEALLEYENNDGRLAQQTTAARARAHAFLFAHQMFRSHRTGTVIDSRMTRFSFPPQWHYDVLRGLDYLQAANAPRDPRAAGAIELLLQRRNPDGRWPMNSVYPGRYHFLLEQPRQPSRWNTLRALRVLRWWNEDR